MSSPSSSISATPKQSSYPPQNETGNQRRWRKTYSSIGFYRGYNFPLYIIFGGAFLGFCLARTSYLNLSNYATSAAPGEWYWFKAGIYRIAIILHLATVLPGGILLVFQFMPIIRRKLLIFHRISGYVVILCLILGTISALILARRSFGGHISTQAGVGMLAILVLGGLGMGYYNIKRLQIDQHRAWMLRVAFYCGSILTMRLIMIVAATILPMTGKYYGTMSCDQLASVVGPGSLKSTYPQCNGTPTQQIPVEASFSQGAANVGIALELNFGMALWLALFLHTIGVEIYLSLTPTESERLRTVSYERQVEAGFKHPGSAGLTADRWGDAPAWKPAEKEIA